MPLQGLPEGCTAECWLLQPAGIAPSEVLREDRDAEKREVCYLCTLGQTPSLQSSTISPECVLPADLPLGAAGQRSVGARRALAGRAPGRATCAQVPAQPARAQDAACAAARCGRLPCSAHSS